MADQIGRRRGTSFRILSTVRKVLRRLAASVPLAIGVLGGVASVITILQFFFPGASLADLWTRYVVPLWQHGTIGTYAKAFAIAVVGLVLIVVIPYISTRRIKRSPSWLSLPVLKFLVQSGVTLLDVVLLVGCLYIGYQFGMFPRTGTSDALVASLTASTIKIAVAGAILFVKGIVSGGGAYLGGVITKEAVKASRSPQDPAEH